MKVSNLQILENIKSQLTILQEGLFGSSNPNFDTKYLNNKYKETWNGDALVQISEIKNSLMFACFSYLDKYEEEFEYILYIPHNVVSPYKYEEHETSNTLLKKPCWRDFTLSGEKIDGELTLNYEDPHVNNNKNYEFYSEENVEWDLSYPKSISQIKSYVSKKNPILFQTYSCDVKIATLYTKQGENKYETALRPVEYYISNIRLKNNLKDHSSIGKELYFEANLQIHDYTTFVVNKKSFGKMPWI